MDAFKVLFVDDEIDFLETLMKRMKKRGVSVSGVGSGEEALKFLDDKPADVVVLDVKMPGLDGLEVLRRIKQEHPDVEVIFLTGQASVDSAMEGLKLGAFDYLMKPIAVSQIYAKVMEAFEKKNAKEERDSRAAIDGEIDQPVTASGNDERKASV